MIKASLCLLVLLTGITDVLAQSPAPKVTVSTSTAPKIVAAARATAENYWKAQKTSDLELFRSVTPHDDMNIVFGWTFVRESAIQREDGDIAAIRDDLREVLSLNKQAMALPRFSFRETKEMTKTRSAFTHKADEHASKIKATNPILGELFKQSFSESITPASFAESDRYSLMTYDYMADVEFQSKAGTTLKKRVTAKLRRLIVGKHDSGWKVFFIPGS